MVPAASLVVGKHITIYTVYNSLNEYKKVESRYRRSRKAKALGQDFEALIRVLRQSQWLWIVKYMLFTNIYSDMLCIPFH